MAKFTRERRDDGGGASSDYSIVKRALAKRYGISPKGSREVA